MAEQNGSGGQAPAPSPAAIAAAQRASGPTPMDTFRTLAPPEGMKFTPLFAVPIKDEDQRFVRLEQSVQALRNDFDTVTPTLVRLAAIEKDIRDLVGQLRTMNDGGPIVEAAPLPLVQQTAIAPAPVVAKSEIAKNAVNTQVRQPAELVSPAPPAQVTQATTPPRPSSPVNSLPGKDVTGGTEAAPAVQAVAGKPAASLPVTPEAAPQGRLPPEGAASPSSPAVKPKVEPPMDLTPIVAKEPVTKPAAVIPTQAPAPVPVRVPAPQVVTAPQPPPAAMPAPTVAPPAPPPLATPKIVMGAIMGNVSGMRIGDHIDKTRLVLDVSAKADFKVRLENEGRRLVIELPHYAWKTSSTWTTTSATLVSGYRYADGAVVVDMLAPAQIRAQSYMPAADGAGSRIVIDLFSSLVHMD